MDETEENISDISCSSSILPSTPKSGRNARKRVAALATSTPVFKLPKKPKARKGKGPIVGVCDKCGKDYVRKKSYEDHMRLHALVGKCQNLGNVLICQSLLMMHVLTLFQMLTLDTQMLNCFIPKCSKYQDELL